MEVQTIFSADPRAASENYRKTGFHVEPDLFPPSLCDELVEVANRFPEVLKGNFRTVLQPHRQSDVFLDTLRRPQVVRIVREFIGGSISAVQSQFFYCMPGTPGFQPHQDNRFVNAPQGAFASAWVALCDVDRNNGGLILYPGSHGEPLLDTESVDYEETSLQDVNAVRLRCRIPDQYKPLDLRMTQGSVVFFDTS